MSFYRGLTWIGGESLPDYTLWRDKTFDGYYGINYAHRGKLFFACGDEEPVRLDPPVAWLTWPGPRFQYGSKTGETWDHRFITFNGPRVREWIRGGLFPSRQASPVYRVSQPEKFRILFDDLLRLVKEGGPSHDHAVHTLEGLLLELTVPKEGPGQSPQRKKILYLSARLRERPEIDWDFQKVAQEIGISYSHFRREFKNETGRAPNQALIESRNRRASVLLRDSKLSLREVAEAVGVSDLNYFCKLFKKQFSLTPTTYRREMHRG